MATWTDQEVTNITDSLSQLVKHIRVPAELQEDALQEAWLYLLEAQHDENALHILDMETVEPRLRLWLKHELRFRQGRLVG